MRKPGFWYLQQVDLFATIPPDQLQAIEPTVRLIERPARSRIELDEAGRVYVIAVGGGKLTRPGLLGRKVVETILMPGDVFGALTTGNRPTRAALETIDKTTLISVPSASFESLIKAHPEFALCVVQLLEDRQRRLQRTVESLLFKDLLTRVVETILWLAREHAEKCQHGWAVDLRITQQDLADLVGATRQAVSGVLGKLERRLLLRRKGRVICIMSMSRLRAMVDFVNEE